MKSIVLTMCIVALLSGCVTETVGGFQRNVNPEKQLKAHLDLGMGYIANGEYARAKTNLTKALALDPNSASAHNGFALVYQLEGDDDVAESYFKNAVSLDPDFTPARNNYGAFLYSKGRYADAIVQLLIASEDRLYQRRAQVFENLGVSYVQLGKISEADAAFSRSLQLNPKQRRALLEMADIRFSQKNYVESRSLYMRHLRVSSQSARSLWLCVRISRVFDSKDKEASCALTLRNVFPSTPEFTQYQATLTR